MGIQDLQLLMDDMSIEGSCVGVDLVRIARNQTQKWAKQAGKRMANGGPHMDPFIVPQGKFSLVIDAECCLDRLYGGYFSDWVCGGQWNRASIFLGQFISSLSLSNIDVVVFFNGCSEQERTDEWITEQLKIRQNINQVLRHLGNKGTPPPKVWWTPPCCLRSTIRMILRNLNVPVIVTMEDHRQEVIAYCRDHNCQGIIADDAEYLVFNPIRYFSARHLKLTYKGTLESHEYCVSALAGNLNLSQEQMCILAALLGNFIMPESELSDLHKKLRSDEAASNDKSANEHTGRPDTIRGIAAFVRSLQSKDLDDLGNEIFGAVGGERAAKFKRAVKYYTDGCRGDFFKNANHSSQGKKSKKGVLSHVPNGEQGLDTSRLASDATGNNELVAGVISVTEAFACLSIGQGESSPARSTDPKQKKQVRLVVEEDKSVAPTLPPVSSEVLRTVHERHSKGLMSPFIYQVLTQREVRLPVVLEDENFKEFPSIQRFYQPLRAMIYAVLFNLNHFTYMSKNGMKHKEGESGQGSVKVPEIKVKEWVWSKANPFTWPESVRAEPLGWGVPTIQRLWFGTTVDDKRRRLRAYLTIMRSDTQRMLNPSYVPQHLLILATVLRYIMTDPEQYRVLRKHELDAIIAAAFNPHLSESEFNQDLDIEYVSPRGVQIGAMIMTGVEYALTANDACGAPIPWLMTFPWLYFDGKLLHSTLARSANVKNLLELCSHRVPQVLKVEQMREAILEDISVQWARPPLLNQVNNSDSSRVHSVMPAGSPRVTRSGGPSIRGRGGRLEIAGVVVGNWGPNCRLQPQVMAPQVTSVGGSSQFGVRGKGAHFSTRGGRGSSKKGSSAAAPKFNGGGAQHKRKMTGQPVWPGNTFVGRNIGRKFNRGRGLSIVCPITGETIDADKLITNCEPPQCQERKMILTNTEGKKQISRMVNGEPPMMTKQKGNEQFEDAGQTPSTLNGSAILDN